MQNVFLGKKIAGFNMKEGGFLCDNELLMKCCYR